MSLETFRHFDGAILLLKQQPRNRGFLGVRTPSKEDLGKCGQQWRNRRGGRGGRVPPRDFWPGNFCWRIWKKEARKKGKRGENWEEKVENWEWKQENVRKRGEDLFFFFFFFFFCFSLLKTTKICFGSTKMGIFYREKAFHAGKKFWKNDFAPSEKYACYAPGGQLSKCFIFITIRLGWNQGSLKGKAGLFFDQRVTYSRHFGNLP